MEADFQRFYHLDLSDLWRGRITPRRAAVLAVNLPAGAQTWVACGHDAAWSMEAHLTAFVADAVQVGNWQRTDGKGPKPKPIPRPGDEVRAKVKHAAIEAKAAAFRSRQASAAADPPPPPARSRFTEKRRTSP